MTGFKLGDRGPAVAEVRARLARLGLLPGSQYAEQRAGEDPLRSGMSTQPGEPWQWQTTALASAEFDETVESAVRTFQEQRGITVDGVVGPETFRRLEEARWQLGDRILSYAAAHPTVGEDVLDLQKRLNAMGFSCGREDGHLGPNTDAGIREFQRNTGIRSDGVCGPATFRALGRLRRTVGRHSGHAVRERYSLHDIRTGVRGKVVIIDPATGTDAPTQADICGDLAARIEGRLTALGTQVLITRSLAVPGPDHTDDSTANFANDVGADLVLNLTVVNDPDAGAGTATYFYGRDDTSFSVPGQLAATLLLDGIVDHTDLDNRSRHARTWDLLRLTRMPAVRIECGNLAADRDASRLSDPVFVDSLARAIADSVERFFSPEHVL
ncbi:MAG: peptidoglycan-binding protein [Candidatus Nanopelagicales bacterium]